MYTCVVILRLFYLRVRFHFFSFFFSSFKLHRVRFHFFFFIFFFFFCFSLIITYSVRLRLLLRVVSFKSYTEHGIVSLEHIAVPLSCFISISATVKSACVYVCVCVHVYVPCRSFSPNPSVGNI